MLSWALQMEQMEWHSSAFTSYLKFSSQLKRQSICSCTKRKQGLINEVPRKKQSLPWHTVLCREARMKSWVWQAMQTARVLSPKQEGLGGFNPH